MASRGRPIAQASGQALRRVGPVTDNLVALNYGRYPDPQRAVIGLPLDLMRPSGQP